MIRVRTARSRDQETAPEKWVRRERSWTLATSTFPGYLNSRDHENVLKDSLCVLGSGGWAEREMVDKNIAVLVSGCRIIVFHPEDTFC